ncbi:MAG: hypothetical protein VB050_09155 [Geobacteraceae bacterium]|nr:hypothetical protein [Geobacteraceae bacterium]
MRYLTINSLVAAVIALAIPAGGCSKIRPAWDESTAKLKGAFSSSGEKDKETDLPKEEKREEVKRGKYACQQSDAYQLFIEKSEIRPGQVSPDDEIKHTLEYSLCAPSDDFTIQGTLTRRIVFKGKVLFKDSGIETFNAGKDSIKAEITIPKRAPTGTYTLETIIQFENTTIRRSANFFVKPK